MTSTDVKKHSVQERDQRDLGLLELPNWQVFISGSLERWSQARWYSMLCSQGGWPWDTRLMESLKPVPPWEVWDGSERREAPGSCFWVPGQCSLGGRTWSPPKHSMSAPSVSDKLVVNNPTGSEMTDKQLSFYIYFCVCACMHVPWYTCQRATHKSRLSFLGLGRYRAWWQVLSPAETPCWPNASNF